MSAPTVPARTERGLFDWKLGLGILGVGILLVLSLFTGVYDIVGADNGWEMFAITRIPRTIALVLAGAAMAMSGLVMQLLTQNRFVEPTTAGTTEWAGLGLILMMILVPGAGIMPRMAGAIAAAFVGTMIFFLFLRRVSLSSSLIAAVLVVAIAAYVVAS